MKYLLLALFACSSVVAEASECRTLWEKSLEQLRQVNMDGDLRAAEGRCLLRFHLDKPQVTQAVLKILRDGKEDVLLREDLVQAFSDSPLRKSIKVEGTSSPELDNQDKLALDRTVASAQGLLDLSQAMKSMNEIVPATKQEQEFLRTISELALDETNPVILRAAAVSALEEISKKIYASGIYEERGLRQVREALSVVAGRADNSSYFTGAASAYERLASAGLPSYQKAAALEGRALASDKSKK